MTPNAIPTETRVVDPALNPTLAASIRGGRVAVARCGHWPTVGTLHQYAASYDRARRELDHTLQLAHRYWRRFGHPVDDGDPILARLLVRREVARCTGRPARRVHPALDGAGVGLGVTRAHERSPQEAATGADRDWPLLRIGPAPQRAARRFKSIAEAAP